MTGISKDVVFCRAGLPGSQIDDEVVFFNQKSGTYFATGSVGAVIWGLLEKPQTIDSVCDQLQQKYDVDRDTCEVDVTEFFNELLSNGIILVQD